MPDPIRISVELDTKSAQVSIDELERRIARINKASAALFRNISNPARQQQFAQQNFPEVLNPHYETLNRMRETERMLNAPGVLASRINQGLGIGGGQNRPNTRTYQAFWQSLFPVPLPTGTMSKFMNTSLGIGSGQNMPNRKEYENFWKQAVPPFLPKPQPTSWGQAGLGAATSMFSPWLGVRMLNQAFSGFPGMGGGAAGGGGGRGLAGAIFGGSMGSFGIWYAMIRGLQSSLHALTRIMTEAVRQGQQIFQGAAGSAMTGQNFAQLRAVLTGIGMGGSVNRMATPFARGMGASSSDLMLRSMMTGGSAMEMNQIMNMRKEIDALGKAMEFGSKRIGETSGAMNRIGMGFGVFGHNLKAVFADLTAAIEPQLRLLAEFLSLWAKSMDFVVRHARGALLETVFGPLLGKGMEKALQKLFPPTKGGNDIFAAAPGGQWMQGQSSWEKMGLLINGGPGGRDYACQTAENTKKIADHVTRLFPNADTSTAGGTQPGFNLP